MVQKIQKEIFIGDRIYEIIQLNKEMEGEAIIEYSKTINTHLGKEEAKYISDNQNDIPGNFKNYTFLFTNWENERGYLGTLWCAENWLTTKEIKYKLFQGQYYLLLRRKK